MVLEEEADIDVGLTCFSIEGAHTKMKAVAIKSKGGSTGGPTTFAVGGTMS